MKILVVGTQDHFQACGRKFHGAKLIHLTSHAGIENQIDQADVVFDFFTSDLPESCTLYRQRGQTAFLNTWKVPLAQLLRGNGADMQSSWFGFNGFPTMFEREFLEVSVADPAGVDNLQTVCGALGVNYHVVDDRVGFVTPRVICMIINEAYFAVQEGTASRDDIDLAMKLGTNYPYGPFEWCERIGPTYVYQLLEALYQDSRDERYKISALLKKEYLRASADD